jgi:hypothetical protein
VAAFAADLGGGQAPVPAVTLAALSRVEVVATQHAPDYSARRRQSGDREPGRRRCIANGFWPEAHCDAIADDAC